MRGKVDSDHLRIVLAAISRAADAGKRCPYNDEIAAMIGAESPATGARVVAQLERAGLISVDRFGAGREVTITATGSKTFYNGKRTAHFRAGGSNRATSGLIVRRPRLGSHDDLPDERCLPQAVQRDPCPRCGVRGDIGCDHRRAPLSMGAF